MVQPSHRVAADVAIALRDVSPVDVRLETDKNTHDSLVCAAAQHDLVTFPEDSTNRFMEHHVRNLLLSVGLFLAMVETSACSRVGIFPAWPALFLSRPPFAPHLFAAPPDRQAVSPR